MESIQQFELILLSKMDSPPSKCSGTEDLIFGETFANDLFLKSVDEFTGIDFLEELDKDEKMYIDELQQITETIDLPLYDFVTGNDTSLDKTEKLLSEFDSIYDGIEELDHLTPPQTPPEKFYQESQPFTTNIPLDQQQIIFDYQEVSPEYIYDDSQEVSYVYETASQSSEEFKVGDMIIDPEPIISSPADYSQELAVVDEIIQAHSRSQSDFDDSTSSSWSPCSEFSSGSSVYSQDDEPVKKSSASSLRGVTKKRSTRPYGSRNPDEKKSRKKEQNKNAATRYRQKKKEEVHVILGEERQLMDKNKKLMTSYKDTKREVKYLKSLLRELFQVRGFEVKAFPEIF